MRRPDPEDPSFHYVPEARIDPPDEDYGVPAFATRCPDCGETYGGGGGVAVCWSCGLRRKQAAWAARGKR